MANPVGRPSDYTTELGDEICHLLAEGRSLNSICKQDDMPAMRTIFAWMRLHEEFSNNYALAREQQADTFADEMQAISDEKTGDVARDRLRIDTRKWIASKLKPKKYGDKLDVEHSGEVAVSFQTIYEQPVKKEDEDGGS